MALLPMSDPLNGGESRRAFSPRDDHLLGIVLVLLVCSGLVQALSALWANTSLQAGDQGAYLQLALAQAEGRALTDGNRHPLYPALLIPLAERDPRFFMRARWVSFGIGALLIVMMVWGEWRRGKNIAALVIAGFLSFHVQMARTLSEIWCEPLVYLLVFLLWKETERDVERQPTGRWARPSLWGALSGLLFLTKGTGLQVAALFWLTHVVLTPRCRATWREFGIGAAVFLTVSSPLLTWNSFQYGSPFYSFASTHNMWFDEADEIWFEDPAKLPTLGSYIATHSVTEVVGRLFRGLLLEGEMARGVLWSDWRHPEPLPFPVHLFHLLFKGLIGIAILTGAFVSLRRRGEPLTSRWGWFYCAALVVFLVPSFGWYAQLTNEPRFLMTLVPVAAVLLGRVASRGFEEMATWFPRRPSFPSPGRVCLALVLVYTLVVAAFSLILAWRTTMVPSPTVTALQQDLYIRLNELPEGAKIAHGPSHGLPVWMARGDLQWRATPWKIDWDRFTGMLKRERIGFVLVDNETIARRPYLERLLKPSVEKETGWKVLFRDRDLEGFFLLFETDMD